MTDRLEECKARHRKIYEAASNSAPELLKNSMIEDVGWLIAEVERLRNEFDACVLSKDIAVENAKLRAITERLVTINENLHEARES